MTQPTGFTFGSWNAGSNQQDYINLIPDRPDASEKSPNISELNPNNPDDQAIIDSLAQLRDKLLKQTAEELVHKADVYALQEVREEKGTDRTDMAVFQSSGFKIIRPADDKGSDTAVAINEKKFKNIENRSFTVQAYAAMCNRDFAVAVATEKATGRKIAFVSGHISGFDLEKPDDPNTIFKAQVGDEEISRMLAELEERCSDCDSIMLGFDTNAIPEIYQERFKLLIDKGFQLHRTDSPTNKLSRNWDNKTAELQERELDFIFVKNKNKTQKDSGFFNFIRNLFNKEKAYVTNIVKDNNSLSLDHTSSPSDHIPVFVRVESIKTHSFKQIHTDKSEDIAKDIAKGYLLRREVTEVLDQINENVSITMTSVENDKWKWEREDNGTKSTIDVQQKTNNTPFWMRRIIHRLQMTFSSQYRTEFNEKVAKATEAFEKFQVEEKKNRVQKNLENANIVLTPLTKKREKLNSDLESKLEELEKLEKARAKLQELDNKLNGYLFKGLFLEEVDKLIITDLENQIYKGQSEGQLKNSAERDTQLKNLESDIQTKNDSIDKLNEEIKNLTDKINNPTKSWNKAKVELEDLKKQLEGNSDPIISNQPKQGGIRALLAGKINIDVNAINKKQDIKNNPLVSKGALFQAIHQGENNEFYVQTIQPSLKLLSLLINESSDGAKAMYTDWINELNKCATAWNASNSQDTNIDSLTDFGFLFENIMKANDALTSLAKSNFNITEFFKNLNELTMPQSTNFTFAVNDTKAEEILDNYLIDSNGTNLSTLFATDTPFHTWTKDCQFFLAASMLKFRQDNTALALKENQNARESRLEYIKKNQKSEEESLINRVVKSLTTEETFKVGKFAIPRLLPEIASETEDLSNLKNHLQSLDNSSDEIKLFHKQVDGFIDFANTKKRKEFDEKYIQFLTKFRKEIISAVLNKEGIPQFKILMQVSKIDKTHADLLKAEMTYLTTLNKQSSDRKKKADLKALEDCQGKQLINTLELLKLLGPFATTNPTFTAVTKALDDNLMKTMKENGALNLENELFIPWFHQNVMNPISNIQQIKSIDKPKQTV